MRVIKAFLYYFIVFFIMCTAGVLFMLYCGLRGHWENSTAICGYCFRKFIFKMFHITVSVEGAENIPKEKGFVIVANHQSFMDTNVIWHSVANSAFLAKASLWKAPIFGWVLTHVGCIPVHKNPRLNAGMGKVVKNRLYRGYNVAVFPEGHRSEDGHMTKFQNGIFRMAKEYRFPILPITLINTGERLPKVKWAINPGEIKMVIHPLVKPEDYADKPMAELRDEMHDLIESALPYKQAEAAANTATNAAANTKEA